VNGDRIHFILKGIRIYVVNSTLRPLYLRKTVSRAICIGEWVRSSACKGRKLSALNLNQSTSSPFSPLACSLHWPTHHVYNRQDA